MATSPSPAPQSGGMLGGLARRIITDGLLPEDKVKEALGKAQKAGAGLVTQLVEDKLVPAAKLATAAAQAFGVPLIDLNTVDIDQETVKLVNEKLIRKHRALPLFKRGKRLYLAVSDPTNLAALDEIKFA